MARFLVLLIILLAVDIYAFQAVRTVLGESSAVARRIGHGLYWGLTALALLAISLNAFELTENWPKAVRVYTFATIFILYLAKFGIAAFVFIDDLRRLGSFVYNKVSGPAQPVDLGRSRFLAQLGLLAGALPLGLLTYGMIRNPYRYRKFVDTIRIPDLPAALDGLKIVQISDMHSGSWTRSEPLHEAVEMINAEAADLVFFTGDLVNSESKEMEPYVDIFKQVRGKHGVYSVMGNHDYGDYHDWPSREAKAADRELFYDLHRRLGWDLLRNENRLLTINGEQVGVLGVENWSASSRFPKKGDLAAAYAGTENTPLKILLSHDPTHWDAKVRDGYPDIALTLSGHTHGMQFGVEIPGFRWSPAQYVYKQWAGLYQAGRQYLYVNRGLGFLGYPGRVGILPEVTVLRLQKA
ncbi:MAG: metallophosphoesterase [Saprospiraceae bacterium]